MPVITAAALKRLAPKADPRIVAAFVAHGDTAFATWGITTAPRLQMFMAQVKVESAGLSVLFEDMTYTAARIHAVWPSRFPSTASAIPYAHNPRALADKVYGGRMGNVGRDDGWLCRGQGLLDNTGLSGFAALAHKMGLTVDQVRAALTSDAGMIDCAAATFAMLGCLPFADRGDIIGCTRRVNGGLIGLTDRRAAYLLTQKVWPSKSRLTLPRAVAAPPAPLPHAAAAAPAPLRASKPVLRTAPAPSSPSWFGWIVANLIPTS